MNLAMALGICPGLLWQLRQAETEAAVLQQTALWAMAFTPSVSIAAGQGLLLEVAGCLRYFGGFELLLQRVQQGLLALGFQPRLAAAPNPAAAMLLAQEIGHGGCVAEAQLLAALDTLPLHGLRLSPRQLDWLQGLGVRQLGDCRRLPRAGLSQRLGPDCLLQLDRLYGLQPDPRPLVVPPMTFCQSLALPYPVEQAEALLFAGRRLCESAAGFLAGHGAGARLLQLGMDARNGQRQTLQIGMLTPSRNAEQFVALLREHLQHTRLQAAVESLQLSVLELEPLAGQDQQLWQQGPSAAASRDALAQLVSRLQARLGGDAVQRIGCVAEHRPEKAWVSATLMAPIDTEALPGLATLRPAWLLPEPQLLSLMEGAPWHEGPLQLSAWPERLETGWWDELPLRRDYFMARSGASQACFWVFREHASGLWYLHGVFA
jgi:protein ImuB